MASHGCNPVKVRVVVQDPETAQFGGRRGEQAGDLAPALVLGREQALNLSGASQMIGGDLDQLEGVKSLDEPIRAE